MLPPLTSYQEEAALLLGHSPCRRFAVGRAHGVRKLVERIAELSGNPRLRGHRGLTFLHLCPDPEVPTDSWYLILRDGSIGLTRCPRGEEEKLRDPHSLLPMFASEDDLLQLPLVVVGKAFARWGEFRQKVESILKRLWERP